MRRRQQGVALIAVMVFVALATSGLALFMRRASLDTLSIGQHENAARAEALARGGVQLAIALLIDDRLREQTSEFKAETLQDEWAVARTVPLAIDGGGTLRLSIEDAGSRLNLNALFDKGAPRSELCEPLLVALLQKALDELPASVEKRDLDAEELAHNLMDYVDSDDQLQKGGSENEVYQARRPPSQPANRPLLSVDELASVEGFTPALVDGLRPYVSVLPLRGDGINPNTAPPWVLALIYTGQPGAYERIGEEEIRRILEIREGGSILCADQASHPSCTPLREALPNEIFPPPTFASDVFFVRAEADFGSATRTVLAVVDRHKLAKPAVLAYSVY
jgi:general secretion pathway protein K